MPPTRRSARIPSISSTDLCPQKLSDICNLCSQLFPSYSNVIRKFSSIQMKTDHAQIHTDQSHRLINIFRNNSKNKCADKKMMQICFGVSINNRNENRHPTVPSDVVDKSTESVRLINSHYQSIPTISLYSSDTIECGVKKIRLIAHKSGRIPCKICTSAVHIIDKNCDKLKLEGIVLHSTKHLFEASLYTCRICEYSTNLLETMQQHHFEQHLHIVPATMNSSKYFSVHYLTNEAVILETIKKCFRFELIDCENKFFELQKSHESSTELRLILLRKQLSDKKSIECRKCAKTLSNCIQNSRALQQHAQIHLINKPLLRCLLCDVSKTTTATMLMHISTDHSKLIGRARDYYVDESVKFDKEIDEMLYECFHQQINDGNNKRLNRQLFELRKRIGASKRVRCDICSVSLSTKEYTKNSYRSEPMVLHALLHSAQHLPLFVCNICNVSTTSHANIIGHIRSCHSDINVRKVRCYYKNNTDQYESEIVDLLKKCFSSENTISPNKKKLCLKSNKSIINFHTLYTKFKSKKQIGSFCDELIKMSINEFDRLECKICTKEILAVANTSKFKWVRRSPVMEHALVHTELPLFICDKCGYESPTRTRIIWHNTQMHKSEKGLTFRDNRDKFQNEIIEALKKCYQKN